MVVPLPHRTARPRGHSTDSARVAAFCTAAALLAADRVKDRRIGRHVDQETVRRAARDQAVAKTVCALEATAKGRAVLQSYALAEALDALAWTLPVSPIVDRALGVILDALVNDPNGWQ